MNNSWLQSSSANRLKQSYVQGFADISGNVIVRNGSVSIKTGKLLIPQGDISMNGNIICSGSISLGATAGSGYQMTVNGNTRIKNSILVDNDASVMSSLGVGKAFDDAYHLDVSGATRISSALSVGGATTLGSITNVSGQSKFTGNVGIGANPDPDYALYAVGQVFATGRVSLNQSLTVGPDIDFEAEVQGAAVYVKVPLSSTAPNDVVMNVPNNLYTSIDSTNQSKTNKLEIDTKNHVIKPSIYNDGAPVSDSVNGWDLGATGANSFNRVYGRTLEVSQNVGIGKSSDAGYAMDVSGATRLSSSLVVGGAATLGTITNVTGTSKFTGSVGIGKAATSDIALDISGVTMVSGNTYIAKSLVIGNTVPSTATLHVNASANTAANSVVLEGANVLFKGQSSENLSHTNFLEIDTKTRSILPYAQDLSGATLNSMETGWNLGGAGANRFSKIYGRDLEISTNTIKIEDNSGNQISMSFDATTGAVNYTVTTISGEVFVIKGVQTQKVSSSGSGTIDPALLEFTGLSFGDMFTISDAYNLANTFTYNLATTTYTGDGTTFASSSGAQTLDSFVTGTNLTTLLALVPTGTSVIINVGATDGRAAHLEGIDVDGSLVSLTNKIISVKKTGASTSKWTLWNSDGYQNVAGNYLHYVELKNINMISGTYFIPKVPGTMTYNISDTQYMETTDLTAGNGDIYLYVNRGPGKNWTKVRVALPQAGTIQTQHMADSAITTAKLADASVTGTKLADGSILGSKITDGSLISSKIADSNVTTAKLADGAVTGAKLAGGVINAASLIADGIITGAKLASGAIVEAAIGTESVTETKIGVGAVTTTKLADNAVTVDKLADGSVSSGKLAVDSIYNQHIAGGAVTTAKISDGSVTTEKIASGAITTAKLATGVITGSLLDASSVTMEKIASGAISTDKITGFAVTAEKIASGAITEAKLADGSVTSAKFAADSVTETKIIDNAITSAKILNYAVTADKIAGSAITSGKIADGSIFESKLGASVVTTDKLANLSVTSEKLADFAVTEYKIRDGSITFAKFAAGALSAGPVGPAGVDGTIGSTGPTGIVGPAGIDGTAGTTGAVGPTGPAASASSGPTDSVSTKTLTVTDATQIPDAIITTNVANAKFGAGSVMSNDGTVIVVRNAANLMYIYRLNTSTKSWVNETTKTGYAYFGLSGNGNIIVTSDGTANTKKFTYSGSTWDAGTVISGGFKRYGKHITMNYDGSKIVFCTQENPSVRMYSPSDNVDISFCNATNATYKNSHYFQVATNFYNQYDWYSCQLSNDGNTLVASSSTGQWNANGYWDTSADTGLVKIFKYLNGAWVAFPDIVGASNTRYGNQCCVNSNGTVVAFSTGRAGYYTRIGNKILIYSYVNGVWTLTGTILRDKLSKTNYFGARLRLSDDGLTLAVGCNANTITTDITAANISNGGQAWIEDVGFSNEAYLYKYVNGSWNKYSTCLSNIYRNNLQYRTSGFGISMDMDVSGNFLVLSEDNYYSPDYVSPSVTGNSIGRFHIYNINSAYNTTINSGLVVNNDIMVKKNIISNGILSNDKIYTNNVSVLDSLTIGGPPCYGPMYNNPSTTDKYVLFVRNTSQNNYDTPLTSAPWSDTINSKSRFEGGLYIYGSVNGSGINSYVSAQLLGDGTFVTIGNVTASSVTANKYLCSGVWDLITNSLSTDTIVSKKGITCSNGLSLTNDIAASLYTTISGVTGTPIVQNSFVLFASLCAQSLSWDGNTLVVVSGTKILIYKRNSSTFVWDTTPTTITSSITITLVVMSGNGTKIAITNGTTVLMYIWGGSSWSLQTQTIVDLSGKAYTSNFARNIRLSSDGSKILIVAYTSAAITGAYVYNTVSGAQLIDIDFSSGGTFPIDLLAWPGAASFCHADFSPNGNTIIAGKPVNDSTPKLYVWDINYSTSTVTRGFITPNPGTYALTQTGRGLSISSDGNVLSFVTGYFAAYYWNDRSYSSRIIICRRANNSSQWTTERIVYYDDILATNATAQSAWQTYSQAAGSNATPGGEGMKQCISGDGNTLFVLMGNYVTYSKYKNGAWGTFTVIPGPNTTGILWGTSVSCDYTGEVFTVTEKTTLGNVYIYYTNSAVSTQPFPITAKDLVIKTGPNGTGQLYISSDGDVGIGSTAVSGTKLSVTGTITATGSITANSDDRLKENEELIVNATDTIMKLRPEYYSKKPTFDSTDITTWRKESGLIAQEVWYATPELRHLVTLGQDISGVTYEHEPATTTLVYNNDVSNNPIGELSSDPNYKMRIDTRYNNDVSNNPTGELNSDPNYNISKTIVPYVEPTEVTIPGKVITKPRYVPIDPANIINIPLTPDTDIQQDPDYKALGWGDTPSSLNYIGLIPYLIKSIQELKTEIDGQRSDIEQQKTYIQTLETRLNP